ncbi:putative leucine-rich repeat-containing protein DDB_G0290503 [Onthophagus taurus]|uniref:putative leucine-rich repeat-containing protein DDB_G0290503 n=1 Tax=Onthophagus taurus TaxID=166361 RepID=UPI0039BE62AC
MDLSVLDYDMGSLKPNIMEEKIFRCLQNYGWSSLPTFRYIALTMFEVNPKDCYDVDDDEIFEKSLILSIQTINNNLAQPIGCLFYKRNVDPKFIAEKLEHYIKDLIKCELFVVTTISNVSDRIKKVIDILIKKSKPPPKDNYEALIYRVANMDIVHIFDPISLMEDTRDVFLCHNIQFGLLGQKTTGKFADFAMLVQHDCGVEKFKESIDKYKPDSTDFAIAIFSMSSFISLVHGNNNGIIPRVGTKDVVNLFDMAFDTLNTNNDVIKLNRHSILKSTTHHQSWKHIVDTIKSIKLIRNNTRLDLAFRVMITILKMTYFESMNSIKDHLNETTLNNDLYNVTGNFNTPKGLLKLKSEIIQIYTKDIELVTATLIELDGVEKQLVVEDRKMFLLNLIRINEEKNLHLKNVSSKIGRSDGESDQESDDDIIDEILFLNPCAMIPKTLDEVLNEKTQQIRDQKVSLNSAENNDFLLSYAEEQDQAINLYQLIMGNYNNECNEKMDFDELMDVDVESINDSEIVQEITENESKLFELDQNNDEKINDPNNDLIQCLYVLKKLDNKEHLNEQISQNEENKLGLSLNDDYIVALLNPDIKEIVSKEKIVIVYKGATKPSQNQIFDTNNFDENNQNCLHNPKTGDYVMVFKTPKEFNRNKKDPEETKENNNVFEEYPGVVINLIEDNCEYNVIVGLLNKNRNKQIYMKSEIRIEGNRFLTVPNIYLINENEAYDDDLDDSFIIIETCNNCLSTTTTRSKIRVIQIPDNKNLKEINYINILTETFNYFNDPKKMQLFVTNNFLNLINLSVNNYSLPRMIEYNKILTLCNWLYVTEGFNIGINETSLNFSINTERFFEIINRLSIEELNDTNTEKNLKTDQEIDVLNRTIILDPMEEENEFNLILRKVPLCITGWANSCNGMAKLFEILSNKRINVLYTGLLNLNTTRSIISRIKAVRGIPENESDFFYDNSYINKSLIIYAFNHECAVLVE